MNLKEIKKNYKKEKHALKHAYKAARREGRREYREKIELLKERHLENVAAAAEASGRRAPVNPPKRAVLEEIGNAVTHGLGSVFAVFAIIFMLASAEGAREIAGAWVYFAGLFVMFTMSCMYHAFPHGSRVKRIFRRFDYSCIYLLIGATFAPILLCFAGKTFGLVFFIIQWAVIITGITLVGVFGPTRLRFIHIPLYIILGWCGIMFLPQMLGSYPWFAFYILGGGVIYSLGIIPFAMKSRVSHFIWHFFVLAGAVVQWVGIYMYIYLK